jgi:hypothetical protein
MFIHGTTGVERRGPAAAIRPLTPLLSPASLLQFGGVGHALDALRLAVATLEGVRVL